MKFTATTISGVWLIELEPHHDERGWFARSWDKEELAAHGLSVVLAQGNVTFTAKKGTVRGMHYQSSPYEEAKLIRCTKGSVMDVVIDVRPNSPTYTQHMAVSLTADNHMTLYVPEGCAHGFQSLEDAAEMSYLMSVPYAPDFARGVRWNDPLFQIEWPLPVSVIAPKDLQWPDFKKDTPVL